MVILTADWQAAGLLTQALSQPLSVPTWVRMPPWALAALVPLESAAQPVLTEQLAARDVTYTPESDILRTLLRKGVQ